MPILFTCHGIIDTYAKQDTVVNLVRESLAGSPLRDSCDLSRWCWVSISPLENDTLTPGLTQISFNRTPTHGRNGHRVAKSLMSVHLMGFQLLMEPHSSPITTTTVTPPFRWIRTVAAGYVLPTQQQLLLKPTNSIKILMSLSYAFCGQ